jgi:hypothetical protein
LPWKGCFDNEPLSKICCTDTDGLDPLPRELPALSSPGDGAEVNVVVSTNGKVSGAKYAAAGANAGVILNL